MRNDQSGFIGIGSVDISEHFNMMESMDLWICKKCTEIYFWKMSKGTHLTKHDFRSILELVSLDLEFKWFSYEFAKLTNMKKWLIILCGTESINKIVHNLSYELRYIYKFESWHLDQIWALYDFLKFITEMKNGVLINISEEQVSGKMCKYHHVID